MWHFVRSSHCGIMFGIRLLHIIVKQNFSFCGYNHTRKYVQYPKSALFRHFLAVFFLVQRAMGPT